MPKTFLRQLLLVSAITLCTLGSQSVRAQVPGDVETAYLEADFEKALSLSQQIEQSGSLDRTTYVELLNLKLLAQAALQDAAGVDATLRALVELDRTHSFGPSTPPDLQARFLSIRQQSVGEPAVALAVRTEGPDLLVSAELLADPASLLRYFEVSIDGATFAAVERWPLRVQGRALGNVFLRVRAIGPAKITIAETERRVGKAHAVDATLTPRISQTGEQSLEDDEDNTLAWVVLGTALIVVAAGATAAAIVLSHEPTTTVRAPMFRDE